MAIASVAEDRGPRLAVIDVARGVAIAAMVVYHAAYDLGAHGLIAVDVTENLGWVLFARSIAGSFLLLVGISLVLATRRGLRLPSFLRRLAFVAAGAVLVSVSTWWIDPGSFVFFGILHQIAAGSVLALLFLRLPTLAVAAASAAVFALPYFFAHTLFDTPALWWVGLSTNPPLTVDYVPIFPWFAVILAGIVVGRLGLAAFGDSPLARWRPSGFLGKAAVFAGRWSLAIYLIHQPLLYGALALAAPYLPARDPLAAEIADCTRVCKASGGENCEPVCSCVITGIAGTDLMTARSVEAMAPDQRVRFTAITGACRAQARPPEPR